MARIAFDLLLGWRDQPVRDPGVGEDRRDQEAEAELAQRRCEVRVIHRDLETRRDTISGAVRATVNLHPTIVGVGFGYRF
jgi:hypothetical protein